MGFSIYAKAFDIFYHSRYALKGVNGGKRTNRHFDQAKRMEKSPKAKQYHIFFAKHPSLSHFTPLLSRMRERRRRLSLQKKKHLQMQVFFGVRQRHILPGRVQPSTFCAARLNDCVRYENRWDPRAITTGVVKCVINTFTTA